MMKFGQLIIGKIIKIVATRCQILRLKCTEIDFGWGIAPYPSRGAYSGLPDSLQREGDGAGRGRGGEGGRK